jgi:hypothetical protein
MLTKEFSKNKKKLVAVSQAYSLSYSDGRDQEACGSMPARAKHS